MNEIEKDLLPTSAEADAGPDSGVGKQIGSTQSTYGYSYYY